ncbi:Mo-dependent nitrogenase C-terminal domain-containing protein [Roseofilum reptotaenium CS-1145]|uniref:Nitrogenase n=1 Tax=Roseofilum reptotaenium AO1-A TaxID=1925591 RepID=A0A1L9QP31_9CYAN|nr:Mo-dependent nitrogenase C-terminal domain-containing protein [Roseofilum reptotaenium]MDB9516981.1 Mo-dependent nitrogenase C-terminal domain-containing protein [Roseofilum reptotaenium CS-1145]OJJ24396.1 nitrogenase [Roseofilum reptotaenium AO1-A]
MFKFLFTQRPTNPELRENDRTITHYLHPLRRWLNRLEIRDENIAHFLCRLIPVQCPFARDLYLFGRKIGHIPPLCKLNPLYEEVVGLRFRALCYLADECGQDIRIYC